MCWCTCVDAKIHVYTHLCRGPKMASGVFLGSSPLCLLRQSLSVEPRGSLTGVPVFVSQILGLRVVADGGLGVGEDLNRRDQVQDDGGRACWERQRGQGLLWHELES